MLNNIARKISDFLSNKKCIMREDIDVYTYGFELLISFILGCFSIIVIGLFIGCFLETLVFLSVFIVLRSYTGGYHAKTYFKCYAYTIIVYLSVMLFSNFIRIDVSEYLILFIFGISLLIIFAPVSHKNKKIKKKEIRKNKIISIFIFSFFAFLGILMENIFASMSNVIFHTLVMDLLLMISKKINK